jgi:hypothetical protein
MKEQFAKTIIKQSFSLGTSMGLGSLNLGNLTLDPSNLNLDKKLLGKLKNLMPGQIFFVFLVNYTFLSVFYLAHQH